MVPQSSARSFLSCLSLLLGLCLCMPVFCFGASLSSAGQAVGYPSVTLLAAGIFCGDSTLGWSMQAVVSVVDGVSCQ